jgi:lipoprotein-releasing system ATP-binding protein
LLEVLKGINLSVKKGEMVGVVGASGAGKSTLLHILGTLDRPSEGKIYFEGVDLFSLTDKQLASFRNKRIGFIFQFHHLLPEFSALENVMLPAFIAGADKTDTGDKAKELLDEMGLKDRLKHKPGELSGGEQQRVALARALINGPDLVLADEPTGNLDSKTSNSMHELLNRINEERNQTFVIVTHNSNLAKRMERVVHLIDGRVYQED